MRATVHHFVSRVEEACRSPRLLLAGLSGAAVLMLDGSLAASSSHPFLFMMAAAYTAGIIAAIVGAGAAGTSRNDRSWSARFVGAEFLDWAHPPLPLGARRRVLAEALVGVSVILAWRIILEPVALLRASHPLPATATFVADRARDVCLLLPCAVAWLSPSRQRALHVVQAFVVGIVVAALATPAARLGVWYSGAGALALTAALLALCHVRISFRIRRRSATRAHALFRQGRAPGLQLRRDFWLGPLTCSPALSVATAAILLANAVLYAIGRDRSFVSGLLVGLSPAVLLLPLGMPLLGRQARQGGTPLFGGTFASSWSTLPVPREAVGRAVYAHGFAWGCGLTLFALTLPPLGPPWLVAAVGLAASASVAGFVACVAAGDRGRGLISALATVLSLAIGPLLTVLRARGVHGFSAALMVVAAALVTFAMGGLPPLVHLSASRRPVI